MANSFDVVIAGGVGTEQGLADAVLETDPVLGRQDQRQLLGAHLDVEEHRPRLGANARQRRLQLRLVENIADHRDAGAGRDRA